MLYRLSAIIFGFVAAASGDSAIASAYDDFAAGLGAYERDDYANAITGFTAAINAGDLASNLKVTAFLDRGTAYLITGHCKEASQDIAAAKALNANATVFAETMAHLDVCLGDYQEAVTLFSNLISGDARWEYFWERGRARWYGGDYVGALSDFRGVISAKPDNAYPVLWFAMAQGHVGKFDATQLVQDARSLDLDEWPGPLIKLYLGQMRQSDVDAAVHSDTRYIVGRQCEANFYVGEWQLIQNNHAAALPLLQSAAEKCPLNFVEHDAAHVEIARLK